MQQEVIDEAVAEALGAASADTAEQVLKESGILTAEVELLLQGQKTEILKDVSDGYVAKTDLPTVKGEVTTAVVTEVKKYADQQLESYATQKQLTDAKNETMQAVEDLRLESEEEHARLEETKNDITADDGTVWRMGISGGLLYFEKLEG